LPNGCIGDYALLPKEDFDRIMTILKQNDLTKETVGVQVIPIRFTE